MIQKLPSNWKNCATCVRWGGCRRPADPFLNYVEFENNQRGKCYGGVFNLAEMSPTASCSKWEQQYKR